MGDGPSQLLFYPRYHLDNSSLLARYPLEQVRLRQFTCRHASRMLAVHGGLLAVCHGLSWVCCAGLLWSVVGLLWLYINSCHLSVTMVCCGLLHSLCVRCDGVVQNAS